MKFFQIALVLSSMLMFCSAGLAQENKKDTDSAKKLTADQLVGDWIFESGVRAGADVAAERLGSVSFTEKEITIPVPGSESFVMAYKIDNSKSPAHVDIEITGGPAAESQAKGIIALENGKIKLCYHPMNGDRPESFESTEENEFHYFVIGRGESAGLTAADLAGTWVYTSGTKYGEAVGEDRMASDVIFSEEAVTLPVAEGMNFVMAYKLDATASPTAIDLEITEGPMAGSKAQGIIKKEGKELALCYSPDGERPAGFESTAENGCFLFKLKVKEIQ